MFSTTPHRPKAKNSERSTSCSKRSSRKLTPRTHISISAVPRKPMAAISIAASWSRRKASVLAQSPMISTASTSLTGIPSEWNAPIEALDRSRQGVPCPSLNDCRLVHLPKISDPDGRGSLTFAEGRGEVPFALRRSYWIYDVPGGERRHGHAYKSQQEFIIALSGSFRVVFVVGV